MGLKHVSMSQKIAVLALLIASPAFAWRGASMHNGQPGRALVTARAAILIDNNTGEVLWERNPDLPLPPASTTKVVTAMVALRSGRLDDSFRVSDQASKEPPSKVHLRSGWRVRLLDLIYAILLNSANDASVVIAEGISGSVPAFADLMNAQAQRLGATNSHFVNPNGLPAENHYSSARDLATLFSVAVRDPVFDRIVGTETIPIIPTEGAVRAINLRTHNRLLTNYRYDVVGKTGWTIAAKRCFVGAARSGGREVIVAVLGSRDLWGDVRKLIEFGMEGTSRPEIEVLRADAEDAAPRPHGAGDDTDDDRVAYSRSSRRLRAGKAVVVEANEETTRKAAGRSVQKHAKHKRSPASSTSVAKDDSRRKHSQRVPTPIASRSTRAQRARAAQPVQIAQGASHARASAATGVTRASKSKAERSRTSQAVRHNRQRP